MIVVNLVLATMIFLVVWPRRSSDLHVSTAIATLLFLVLWFFFGQSRYGMALALFVPAAVSGTVFAFALCGIVAAFIHKGAAGGFLLLALWRLLRNKKHGTSVALALCGVGVISIKAVLDQILVLTGYANYGGWIELPDANTPLKYYYFLSILIIWRLCASGASNGLLILTFLFLPLSYFTVLAGRSYQLYATIVLFSLSQMETPRIIRILLVIPFLADVWMLVFKSGLSLLI